MAWPHDDALPLHARAMWRLVIAVAQRRRQTAPAATNGTATVGSFGGVAFACPEYSSALGPTSLVMLRVMGNLGALLAGTGSQHLVRIRIGWGCEDDVCPAGKHRVGHCETGQDQDHRCTNCPAGKYTDTKSSAGACKPQPFCGAGQSISGPTRIKKRVCSACRRGRFQTLPIHPSRNCVQHTTASCPNGQTLIIAPTQFRDGSCGTTTTTTATTTTTTTTTTEACPAHTSSTCAARWPTRGWHAGSVLATLPLSRTSSGTGWTWQECARECYAATFCEFWTLKSTAGSKCSLKRSKGKLNVVATLHYEGAKTERCSRHFGAQCCHCDDHATCGPAEYAAGGECVSRLVCACGQHLAGQSYTQPGTCTACSNVECESGYARTGTCEEANNGHKCVPTTSTMTTTTTTTTTEACPAHAAGACVIKWDHSGWTRGSTLAQVVAIKGRNTAGKSWTWQECARQCATTTGCSFWTLSKAKSTAKCELKQSQGSFVNKGDHHEGPRHARCELLKCCTCDADTTVQRPATAATVAPTVVAAAPACTTAATGGTTRVRTTSKTSEAATTTKKSTTKVTTATKKTTKKATRTAPPPTTATSTTTATTKTTSTTTTTTIYDPANVDCEETQDECTERCQQAAHRNHRVVTPRAKNGRACVGATDCKRGDGSCPAPTTTTKTTATTTSSTLAAESAPTINPGATPPPPATEETAPRTSTSATSAATSSSAGRAETTLPAALAEGGVAGTTDSATDNTVGRPTTESGPALQGNNGAGSSSSEPGSDSDSSSGGDTAAVVVTLLVVAMALAAAGWVYHRRKQTTGAAAQTLHGSNVGSHGIPLETLAPGTNTGAKEGAGAAMSAETAIRKELAVSVSSNPRLSAGSETTFPTATRARAGSTASQTTPPAHVVFTALYDFDGTGIDNGLALTKGDHVAVSDQSDAGWWKGRVGQRSGWFPASYIVVKQDEPQPRDSTSASPRLRKSTAWGSEQDRDAGSKQDCDAGPNPRPPPPTRQAPDAATATATAHATTSAATRTTATATVTANTATPVDAAPGDAAPRPKPAPRPVPRPRAKQPPPKPPKPTAAATAPAVAVGAEAKIELIAQQRRDFADALAAPTVAEKLRLLQFATERAGGEESPKLHAKFKAAGNTARAKNVRMQDQAKLAAFATNFLGETAEASAGGCSAEAASEDVPDAVFMRGTQTRATGATEAMRHLNMTLANEQSNARRRHSSTGTALEI